jgi:hypothetical protein
LNLELENSFSKIASLWSVHDDMSAKPCQNCKMIMVNYADPWLVHTQVASQLKGVKLELRELKAHSLLLHAFTSCPMLGSDLEACVSAPSRSGTLGPRRRRSTVDRARQADSPRVDPVHTFTRWKIIRKSIFPRILQRSPRVSLKSTRGPVFADFALRPLCFSEINPPSMTFQFGLEI